MTEFRWIASGAVAVRVLFWLVTERVWEDALITLAHARNAVAGIGLTHHPGEGVVHGFTSALSVLVPLVGEIAVAGSGLILLRLVSLVAVVAALAYASSISTYLGLSVWPARMVLLYLAFDPLHVFYSMVGMETEIAVAVLLGSIWYSLRGRTSSFGLSLGLALLARPDFALWAGISLLGAAVESVGRALRAAALAGLIVLPWVVFTVVYYGSPIPQTIVAKALVFTSLPSGDVIYWTLGWAVLHVEVLARSFMPFMEDTLVMAAPIPTQVLWTVGLLMWSLLITGMIATWRLILWRPVVLFVIAYTTYRLFALPLRYFDWYVPPFTAVGILLVAAGIDQLAISLPRLRLVGPVAIAIAFMLPVPFIFGMEARIQTEIEDGNRVPVGTYLASVVAPGEPIGLEPAGYLGYYSRATVYDYPGLTSRASLAAMARLPKADRTLISLIAELRPPWLAIRPLEWAELVRLKPAVAAEYSLCRSFDSGTGDTIAWGGVLKYTHDNHFDVRHRDGCPGAARPAAPTTAALGRR